jgi:diketogulonate reductase-like aldo/keto reductase
MHTVTWAGTTPLPALGLGTWQMGERRADEAGEVAALSYALQLGYRLIDTAEMYGSGGAERVVGRALAQAFAAGTVRRDQVFVVSKVLPSNATRRGVPAACAASLERLGLSHIDLYLLHWRGGVPLAETVAALEALRLEGRVRHWGVSNFDVADLTELAALPAGRHNAVNQVWYSLSQRGIEFDLLPWQRARQPPLPTMAYSPIDQGALAGAPALAQIGARLGVSAAQVALAWVLRQPDVIAIPKAGRREHLEQNWRAATLQLDAGDLEAIDRAFPPPRRKRALAMT